MDQGRQAGGEHDAAEPPPVSVQLRETLVECDRLQPRELVAGAGVAAADSEVVKWSLTNLQQRLVKDRRPSG